MQVSREGDFLLLVEKNGLLTTQSGVQVEEGVIILPKIPFYALRAIIFNVLIYFYSSSPSVRQNQDLENINLVTLLTSSVHKFTFSNRLPLSTALHNLYFVKYDVTVSFLAQVLDTVTYFVSQVLDTAS